MIRKSLLAAAAVCTALVGPAEAFGVPPTLSSVTVENRHPVAIFSAPRSDFAFITLASKPDRATDGSFLSENVKASDILTDFEIQSGRWMSEDQLDPGTYWAMLRASPDFGSCYIFDTGGYDPACAQGYSNVVTLVVPRPAVRYSARVTVLRFLREVQLSLTATPLGENAPYRVCGAISKRRARCVGGTLEGFSWNSDATDTVTMNTRGLPTTTTFTWYVGTAKVATRRVRVR
jgi:hypothetical protein